MKLAETASHERLVRFERGDQQVHITGQLPLAEKAIKDNSYNAAYLDFSLGGGEDTRTVSASLFRDTKTALRLTSGDPFSQIAILKDMVGDDLVDSHQRSGRVAVLPKTEVLKKEAEFLPFLTKSEPGRPGGGAVPGKMTSAPS
jgi:hypothetical protein